MAVPYAASWPARAASFPNERRWAYPVGYDSSARGSPTSMSIIDLLLAAAIGGVCLAVAAILWAAAHRRSTAWRIAAVRASAGDRGVWADALEVEHDPQALVEALGLAGGDRGRRLRELIEHGEPCDFQAPGPNGTVLVQGRALGAVARLFLG